MTALPQNMRALEVANEVRHGIAEFIRDTRALGSRESARVLVGVFEHDHQDRILGAARVRKLLKAVPWLRDERVEKLLRLVDATDVDTRLRDLTAHQRDVIAMQLDLYASGYGS